MAIDALYSYLLTLGKMICIESDLVINEIYIGKLMTRLGIIFMDKMFRLWIRHPFLKMMMRSEGMSDRIKRKNTRITEMEGRLIDF